MSAVEGWETKRIDEIATIFSGSTPSTSIRSFWDGEIVWVTPNDLSKLKTPYLCDSGKRITEKGLNNCSAQLLPAGSLIISSRAPIGYVALPTVQFCTNQGCKTIRLKSGFHPEFITIIFCLISTRSRILEKEPRLRRFQRLLCLLLNLTFPRRCPNKPKSLISSRRWTGR